MRIEKKNRSIIPGESFPRVHDLDELSRTVSLISEFGEITHQEIGRNSEHGLRNVIHCCKIIGLIEKLETTRLAKNFHLLDEREKLGIISIGVERSEVVKAWMDWLGVESLLKIDLSTTVKFVLEMNTSLSKTTLRGRASSLKSLVSQAMKFHPSVHEDYDFLLPPKEAMKRDNNIQKENIFESNKTELVLKKLSNGSKFIRAATGFLSIEGYDILARNLEGCQIRIIIGDKDVRRGMT